MATRLKDLSERTKYQRPTQLIRASDLIANDNVDVSEITKQIREINDVFKREYEQDEMKLVEARNVITTRLLGYAEALQNGVNAGSTLHVDSATRIMEILIELHGLKKPVNKKPENKVDTHIQLVMGKPRK